MLYRHTLNGLEVVSGDILFTRDGVPGSPFGQVWALLGRLLLPGDLDHCLLYAGPRGRCIESAARGVRVFDMPGETWDSEPLAGERLLLDELVGAADPLAGRGLSPTEAARLRESVLAFCMGHAVERKPYNLNFFNPDTDGAFYCSQLVYRAYLHHGLDLRGPAPTDSHPILGRIVLPENIWNACHVKRRVSDGS
jgi:hypothetical protein